MNKADSERAAAALEKLGWQASEDITGADVIVLNSCSVRESAEQRVLGKLGMLKKLKRREAAPVIILAGCMVGEDSSDLQRRLPYVDAFLRPADIDGLLGVVTARYGGKTDRPDVAISSDAGLCETVAEHAKKNSMAESSESVARWVTIIHGCNNFCSYCIVPYRRGRERSRPVSEIVAEVEEYVSNGALEVTLLGQNVDSYGHDLPGRPDLADLLVRLNDVAGLERIRFLTSHPKDMSERLMQAVAELPKVCQHINLPFQHGDDAILKSMGRGYTVQQYRDLVTRLRGYVPDVSLATDVIVGYPGETNEQFEHTVDLLRELRFDVVHVAAYSPREGTRAAKMPDDVPAEEKKRRLAVVESLQEAVAMDINQSLVGNTVEVLVESLHKGKWRGRTRGNKLVFLPGTGDLMGKLVKGQVERATAWSLQCRLVQA
jgi:tRNA-2-methylthio-N6-dimethylallyladenosine synthase